MKRGLGGIEKRRGCRNLRREEDVERRKGGSEEGKRDGKGKKGAQRRGEHVEREERDDVRKRVERGRWEDGKGKKWGGKTQKDRNHAPRTSVNAAKLETHYTCKKKKKKKK